MRKKKEASDESAFADAAPPKRLTPTDIQEKVFRQAFRGYDERDVDEFLDRATEELARVFTENKRLREELTRRPTVQVQIPSAARAATGAVGSAQDAADTAPIREVASSFIAREREFLRSLAGLIQEHAESVKEDVRRVREAAPAAAPQPGGTRSAPVQPAVPAPAPTASTAPGLSDPPGASLGPESAPAMPAQMAETTWAEASPPPPAFVDAPMMDPGPMVADPGPLPPPDDWPAEVMSRPPSATSGPSAAPNPGPAMADLGASEASPRTEPARSHTQASPQASEAEDQTIRELFWGEE